MVTVYGTQYYMKQKHIYQDVYELNVNFVVGAVVAVLTCVAQHSLNNLEFNERMKSAK